MGKTLFDKIWDAHVVESIPNGPDILYIDKHLIHEVTSPQAFNELKERRIRMLRPERTVATADHNTPTENQHLPIRDLLSRKQLQELTSNCEENNITLYGLGPILHRGQERRQSAKPPRRGRRSCASRQGAQAASTPPLRSS